MAGLAAHLHPRDLADAMADKLAFLEGRTRDGTAGAVEFAALAAVAKVSGDIPQAWAWTCRGFREDALNSQIGTLLLDLADQVPASEAAPYLDLILLYDDRPGILTRALGLRYGRALKPLVGRARAAKGGVDIWFAGCSRLSFPLKAHTDAGDWVTLVSPEAAHPMSAAFGYGASVSLPWGRAMTWLDLEATQVGVTWIQNSIQRPLRPRPVAPASGGDGRTTIIIPIHGAAKSLRACLQSLRRDGEDPSGRRLLLVDDCSPDPEVASLLREAEADGAEILSNPRNLGFTASINRGLSRVTAGDIVLLNSDTIVPRHWLSRLKRVAAENSGIGTVTPLSNNGESVSAPLPFRSNPLPDPLTIDRMSEELWSAYSCRAVDIPAGLGFCLFVTEAARAVGGLMDEENFGRGYLEEVDFCLRVKKGGLRNVCAPGVYIGHRGEASFGLEKAYLVSRNTRVLKSLHPQHDANYQAFALADPLREMRFKCDQLRRFASSV